MKIIAIEINVEGDSCDGCYAIKDPLACYFIENKLFEDEDYIPFRHKGTRLPACIEAEQLHKDAVTVAGHICNDPDNLTCDIYEEAASRILKGGPRQYCDPKRNVSF